MKYNSILLRVSICKHWTHAVQFKEAHSTKTQPRAHREPLSEPYLWILCPLLDRKRKANLQWEMAMGNGNGAQKPWPRKSVSHTRQFQTHSQIHFHSHSPALLLRPAMYIKQVSH